jgi:hypothetical protein
MNILRWIKAATVAGVVALGAWTTPAGAQAPYYFTGTWGGYPFGWGYFGYATWPYGYWSYPYNYGFDYAYIYYHVPTYGVLAWSRTQEVGGFAWGASSIDQAAYQAVSYCAAQDCEPVVWVSNGCAALATSSFDRRLGWAYAYNKSGALSAARRACVNSGGRDCVVRGWVCSF